MDKAVGKDEFCVIVIGASAGGVEALRRLFRGLRPNLPAAILIVLHTNPTSPSYLADILNSAGHLSVHAATVEEKLKPGLVYVAPPNRHLVLEDGSVVTTTAPKENRSRPAINPLFRTAALAYGNRVIGVILSGTLDDGTAGLWEIKRRGGVAIVQAPDDAQHRQMPQSALDNVEVDYSVPISEMAALLTSLCRIENLT